MKEELNGCLKIKLENWKKEEFMSKKNLWSKQIKEMIWEYDINDMGRGGGI